MREQSSQMSSVFVFLPAVKEQDLHRPVLSRPVHELSVSQRTVKMSNRSHLRKGVPWPFDADATHAVSATQPSLQQWKKMQAVANPYQPPILHMSPSRYTINVTEYARAVMYPTWNSGHFHPLVSLRMTATVDMHCIART